jgi:FkbM family methyltransferase
MRTVRSVKAVIKQVLPPIAVTLAKKLLQRKQPIAVTNEQRTLREAHERLNQSTNHDEICVRSGLTLKLHPESRPAFEAFCFTYPEMVAEMDSFILHTTEKYKLLDIGALHGIFSLVFTAIDPSRKAVAVDASPIAFARLLYNTHKNQIDRIVPIECALSDGSGTLDMHLEWEHAVAAGTDKANGLIVEKRTGDDLCQSLRFEPDVIKIDVEGHELKVLRGLRATIEAMKPLLFLEIHPRRLQEEDERIDELGRFFTDLNYRAVSVNGHPVSLSAISKATSDFRLVLWPSESVGAASPRRKAVS